MCSTARPQVDLEALAAARRSEDLGFCLLDLSPACPFRPLDWRWAVAGHLARAGSRSRRRWIDAPTRRAASFLDRQARTATSGRRRRSRSDPAIIRAFSLRSGPERPDRDAVESLLLAGLDDREVAAAVRLDPEVVAAYHDLFFAVRPLLGHPDAVLARAFGPSIYLPSADVGLAVRLLAYHGGPVVARALVAAILRPGAAVDVPGDGHRELVEHFEEYVLAASLPADGRAALAALRLHDQAEQLARDEAEQTVAGVTRPLAIGVLDAPKRDQADDSWHARGRRGRPRRGSNRARRAARDRRVSCAGPAVGGDSRDGDPG